MNGEVVDAVLTHYISVCIDDSYRLGILSITSYPSFKNEALRLM